MADSAGGQVILDSVRNRGPWLKHPFTDGSYGRTWLMEKAAFPTFVIEIVRRSDRQSSFDITPRRWVLKRTFGWMIRWRRLVDDYEKQFGISGTIVHVVMRKLLLRRIAHQ